MDLNSTTVKFKHESASANLRKDDHGVWNLTSVYSESRGKGHASELMRKISEYADVHGITVNLMAREYGAVKGLTNQQLVTFYRKYGFVVQSHKRGGVLMFRVPRRNHTAYNDPQTPLERKSS